MFDRILACGTSIGENRYEGHRAGEEGITTSSSGRKDKNIDWRVLQR